MSSKMIKFQVLNAYFTERLMLAVQDIMKVVGDTLSEYQEETDRTKRENEKLRRRLRDVGLHADPGFPTDLAKIKIEDREWLTKYGAVRDKDGYSTEEPKKKKVKTKHIDGELLLDCDHTQDAQELLMQIEDLQERLKDAETQIRNLQKLNLQLQEGIPAVINSSMQSALIAQPTLVKTSSAGGQLQTDHRPKEGEISGYLSPMAVKISQRCSNYKKLTRTLLCAMFTEQQLISCSVTGKKGVNAEIKESLDIDKVNMIIDYVKKVFPHTEVTDIKACMAQKLKDTRIRARRTEAMSNHS
ncbi:hypothetical protein AGOR_G00154580 [Albula goreensis]|uniref:BEN domain-containing protein n=1 Tax=Albula goreensis TaxID=1534307 RepID=A0A8T3D492_9TELE|nr:hypothetical protein AGOR_G00154580 [Albula goreensis]